MVLTDPDRYPPERYERSVHTRDAADVAGEPGDTTRTPTPVDQGSRLAGTHRPLPQTTDGDPPSRVPVADPNNVPTAGLGAPSGDDPSRLPNNTESLHRKLRKRAHQIISPAILMDPDRGA